MSPRSAARAAAQKSSLLVVAVLSACAGNAPVSTARFVLPQVGGAVEATRRIPSLAELEASVGITPPSGEIAPVEGTAEDPVHGEVDAASPIQAERPRRIAGVVTWLGFDGVSGLVRAQLDFVEGLDLLTRAPLMRSREARYRRAREAAVDADYHLAEGNLEAALSRAISSANDISALQPRSIARSMITAATELLRRDSPDAAYSPQERERAERLLVGARAALEKGDARRAMQRAFYACLLLGVDI